MITNLKEFRKSVVVRKVEDVSPAMIDDIADNCVAVRMYAEYMFIEVLSDGRFSLTFDRSSYVSKNIKKLEKILWNDFAKQELKSANTKTENVFNKVLKKIIKTGVTPKELGYIVFADMYQMLDCLDRAGLGLEVLLEESKRPVEDDELLERIEARVKQVTK